MKLAEFCIKRPVFATVLSLIIVIIGFICYQQIPTRATPKRADTHILVFSTYSGASQQLIETNVTIPIEQAINNVAGIDSIRSRSTRNTSEVQIEVNPAADYNQVVDKVRNQIEQIQGELPSNMQPPQVLAGGFNDNELIDIAFWSDKRSLSEVQQYINDSLFNKIQQIKGVSSASLGGVGDPAMRIWLNPNKMAELNITPADVSSAINNANQTLPAGKISSRYLDFPITANTLLKTAQQFNDVILKNNNGKIIHIGDIGKAELGVETSFQSFMILNGKPYVDVFINYINGNANPIEIGDQVDALLKQVKPQLPADIHMEKFIDFSVFLRHSIHEVYWTIAISIIFVCLVMFLFLGSLRAAFVPIITIPICLLGGVMLLYLLGLSLNTITLLAMVLSVGLIVDDAIVVVENTHRHIEAGQQPIQAAIVGSREITTPIIAMTLTLVAVFFPIIFIHGPISAFVKSFALALAGSVLISGFVALTLSPTMCAYMLPTRAKQSHYAAWLDRCFANSDRIYRKLLSIILQGRWLIVLAALLIGGLGVYAYQHLEKQYFPSEDTGIIDIYLSPAPGSNLNSIRSELSAVNEKIKSIPAIVNIGLNGETGYSAPYGHVYVGLKPRAERQKSSEQIAAEINQRLKTIPDLLAYAAADGAGMNYQHGFEFAILTSSSYKNIAMIAKQVTQQLKDYPGLNNLDSSMKFNDQQYQVTIDHVKAEQLNVSVQSINNTLSTFLGGVDANSKYVIDDKLYNIITQVAPSYRHQISTLKSLYLRNNNGVMIPLSDVVKIKLINSMSELSHYDLTRSGLIYGQLAPGYSMGQVIKDLRKRLPQILPASVRYEFVGAAHFYLKSSHDTGLLFLAALIFIYLVLAALFESFVDPFVILLGVPLCIVSAMLALWSFGGSLNIFTQIGLITLIGLIAKHGILITQFANNLRQQGATLTEAIINAAALRLRPILMTTAAMVMGAVPLLMSHGTAGANARHQLGIVIVFGLIFGTIFSLLVVPVAYRILSPLRRKM